MSFSLSHVMDSLFGPCFLFRVRREIIGLAQDYWKDPPPETPAQKKIRLDLKKKENEERALAKQIAKKAPKSTKANATSTPQKQFWVADRPQLLQRMWGAGYALPGGDELTDILMKPIGLTGEMSLMDLAAGLGGLARKMAISYGTYVTGYEMDAQLARIGMVMSVAAGKVKQATIEAYDPNNFEPVRSYDALVAREIFYKIVKKGPFFKAVSQSVKTRGHMVFTDYIIPPLLRNDPHVKAWLDYERDATPLSLPEMIGAWKINGFDVRVNEDLTEFYHHKIIEGLQQFTEFLAEHKPDPATVAFLNKELELWQKRVDALEHGLKFYRFYAIKL